MPHIIFSISSLLSSPPFTLCLRKHSREHSRNIYILSISSSISSSVALFNVTGNVTVTLLSPVTSRCCHPLRHAVLACPLLSPSSFPLSPTLPALSRCSPASPSLFLSHAKSLTSDCPPCVPFTFSRHPHIVSHTVSYILSPTVRYTNVSNKLCVW